jgi:hypothetical protein
MRGKSAPVARGSHIQEVMMNVVRLVLFLVVVGVLCSPVLAQGSAKVVKVSTG